MDRTIPIVIATILGIIIMLLPILALTPTHQYSQTQALSIHLSEKVRAAQTLGKSDTGAVAFPSSLIHAGLVLITGLFVASSTSLYVRREILASLIHHKL